MGRDFEIEYIIDEEGEKLSRSNTPMRVMRINLPYRAENGDIIRLKKQ